ncbi:unnamed protein product [Tuber melanosporum]|uniref:(Perigord truffle) hypothetical protein n=1 Tax=Tuber melanosporum (strain Mel28) TaxID=656061 RepID=D5G9C5_TUBMM|nr:uncharacterized protein GSTUM_00003242001 [Tuber melanosporum]CAZ81118.1 unnamed protein product [Tuber melanosporum]
MPRQILTLTITISHLAHLVKIYTKYLLCFKLSFTEINLIMDPQLHTSGSGSAGSENNTEPMLLPVFSDKQVSIQTPEFCWFSFSLFILPVRLRTRAMGSTHIGVTN